MANEAIPTAFDQNIQQMVNAALDKIDYNRGGFLEQFALLIVKAAESKKGHAASATCKDANQSIVIETKHSGVDACALHQFILGELSSSARQQCNFQLTRSWIMRTPCTA